MKRISCQLNQSLLFSLKRVGSAIDHVFICELRQDHFVIFPQEVATYRWLTIDELAIDLKNSPAAYTPWLAEVLTLVRIIL